MEVTEAKLESQEANIFSSLPMCPIRTIKSDSKIGDIDLTTEDESMDFIYDQDVMFDAFVVKNDPYSRTSKSTPSVQQSKSEFIKFLNCT